MDRHLLERGLGNYWGYNTLSYFAPETRYASSPAPTDAIREFKMMVRALHAAGIEVILDVVYNHTAEGSHLGPTLSLRGIDNAAYYRLTEPDRRYYTDFTGCGNTLDMTHPRVLQLIMDSLRYWVTEMHVDGFRFDLASALARELYEVDQLGAFFDIIHQDPVISQVKLIAEPWDLGEGGYQVGNFPVLWTEWNGKYRDAIRRFWRGDGGTVSELATRLAGSADLYEHSGRRPYSSINFVTAHDGFSLHDLVSYNDKHNQANLEDNQDGDNNNLSWNCGVEGATDDVEVRSLRERQKRNLLATLLLSQGVPMIRGGDELSHTQQGDNDVSWLHWDLDAERRAFLAFTRRVIRLRQENRALRRRRFLHGQRIRGTGVKDLAWFSPLGTEMSEEDWNAESARALGARLVDETQEDPEGGRPAPPNTLMLLFNAHHEPIEFKLAPIRTAERWELLLDTAEALTKRHLYRAAQRYLVRPQSLVVLRFVPR
jgi:isoamylase